MLAVGGDRAYVQPRELLGGIAGDALERGVGLEEPAGEVRADDAQAGGLVERPELLLADTQREQRIAHHVAHATHQHAAKAERAGGDGGRRPELVRGARGGRQVGGRARAQHRREQTGPDAQKHRRDHHGRKERAERVQVTDREQREPQPEADREQCHGERVAHPRSRGHALGPQQPVDQRVGRCIRGHRQTPVRRRRAVPCGGGRGLAGPSTCRL